MAEPIEFTIYPDECDAFGHVNQATWLALLERARWALLARGPGFDVFARSGVWPAVRRAVVDFHASAWPGDVLQFEAELIHRGRTSFTLRQRAVRPADGRLIVVAELVFVCIDRDQHPVPIPELVVAALGSDGERRIELPGGIALAVSVAGAGGVPLVLIHGFPFDRTLWRAQLAGLHGHTIIAPDLCGFGHSGLGTGAGGISAYADDIAALLDRLDVPAAVLCGHSMGGYVALDFATRYRDRLRGLVLLDTRAEADSATGKAARNEMIALARSLGAAAVAHQLAPRLFAAETPSATRAALFERMERAPVPAIVAALEAMRDRPDRTGVLDDLGGLPVLVGVGAEDRLTPAEVSAALAKRIPGAELMVFDRAGHVPQVEQPDRVTEVLQRFLDRLV